MQRGDPPPPLKMSACNFLSDKGVPLSPICKVVKNGEARDDLFQYVAKISHPFLKTYNTEFYKI